MYNDSVFNFLNSLSAEVRKARDRQRRKKRSYRPRRKNNRKNTKGRRTQYITEQVPNTFPPKFRTKCIKHSN